MDNKDVRITLDRPLRNMMDLVTARSNSRAVTKLIESLGGRSGVMRRPLSYRPDVSSVCLVLDRRGSCSIDHR